MSGTGRFSIKVYRKLPRPLPEISAGSGKMLGPEIPATFRPLWKRYGFYALSTALDRKPSSTCIGPDRAILRS
jgi:hypothetical protein